MKLVHTNCDYCGSNDYNKVLSAPDHYYGGSRIFTIVKCSQCGLIYTNPVVPKSEIFNYSNNAGYYKPTMKIAKNGLKKRLRDALLREFFNYFPQRKRSYVLKLTLWPLFLLFEKKLKSECYPHFKENGTLIDLGCSYGKYLNDMKKLGWEVEGVEPHLAASKWGEKNLGIKIHHSTIEKFLTKKKYDVVTIRMVLEHVYSPKHVLKKIHSLLKMDGTAVIVIPDFSGFEAQLYKKYAYTLQLPTHITHFTPTTISRYLTTFGFKDIKIVHHDFDRDLLAPLEYMARNKKEYLILQQIFSNKIIRAAMIKPFAFLLSHLGLTSRMTIYARKI